MMDAVFKFVWWLILCAGVLIAIGVVISAMNGGLERADRKLQKRLNDKDPDRPRPSESLRLPDDYDINEAAERLRKQMGG